MTKIPKPNREEREQLLLRGLARLPEMGIEAQWAFGIKVGDSFREPPAWVRKSIRLIFGIKGGTKGKPAKIGLVELAGMFGGMVGMAEGTKLLFPPGALDAENAGKTPLTEGKIQAIAGNAVKPFVERFDKSFSDLPPKFYKGSLATFAAFTEGQSETANAIATGAASDGNEGTVTDEVRLFMWMFWPEASTATSVKALHEWIESYCFIHCSDKLVEKICGEIGFRGSTRGRKKRIPTP